MKQLNSNNFENMSLTQLVSLIEKDLLTALDSFSLEEKIKEAVYYAVMSRGKRISF